MKIFKAHGLGNDIILIQTENIDLHYNFIKHLGNRKLGIGCDQILAFNSNYEVNLWNFDGSIIKMCGNGYRCLAKLINKLEKKQNIELTTPYGKIYLEILKDSLISMELEKEVEMKQENGVFYSKLGNEHKIIFVENNPQDFEKYQGDAYNVSCVWNKNFTWYIRTMEKVNNETLACGSAAFSAAHALDLKGEVDLNLNYKFGEIKHIKRNGKIVQIANAEIVAEIILEKNF